MTTLPMPMERMLFPDKYKSVCLYIEPDYPYIHRELAKHGVTLTLLWEEYRRKCYDEGKKPYMFTQFGEKYRKWARVTKATMRIQHKPGDAIEVDWAGDTIPIFDSVTAEQGLSICSSPALQLLRLCRSLRCKRTINDVL